jgi:hypothetical protein
MNELQNIGVELTSLPFELTHVRTLEYYDGERITECSSQADTYLKVWLDCDDDVKVDRWLILRILPAAITTYLDNDITLRDVITQPIDGFFYVVDEHYSGETVSITRLPSGSLPDDLLPTVDSYHR